MFQVLVGVLALLASSLWALDSVRVMTLELFKDRGPILYVAALSDPSARVAEKACDLLFEANVIRYEKPLTSALIGRPGVASRCLSTARKKKLFGVEMIGNSLILKWQHDVMTAGPREVPFACERAEQFSAVSALSELGGGDPALMECAVAAQDATVRQCCATELAKRGDIAKLLGLAEGMTAEDARRLFPTFVMQAFRPLSLPPGDQAVGRALQMDSDVKRRWVLELGCSLMARGEQREVLRGFVPIIEGGTCNLSTQARIAFAKTEAWSQLCPEIPSLSTDQPVEKSLCTLFSKGMIATAAQRAHNIVMAATRAMALEASANILDDGGRASASAARARNPFDLDNMRIIDFDPPKIPVNPYSSDPRCLKRQMAPVGRIERILAGDPTLYSTVSTYDCDSKWDADYTVSDLRRDRNKALTSAARNGGSDAGDTSKIESEHGARAVRAARERIANVRKGK